MRRSTIGVFVILAALTGCAGTQAAPPEQPTPTVPSAPWSAAALPQSHVLPVYLNVWRAADNRSKCALLAPASLPADGPTGVARSATFSGGWAVAYDLPQERSAFGIAGSGTDAKSPDIYDKWPHKITWADGSSAGYGIEGGGAGTNWLAYVKIPGQECLYNVWSRRGRTHLEQLLASLRFVQA